MNFSNLSSALMISVLGIALVFIGILALWALMAVLVKVFADRKKIIESKYDELTQELEQKRLAAAVAVACAIQLQSASIGISAHKERAIISAWQAAYRSQQIDKHSFSHRIHKRGSKP